MCGRSVYDFTDIDVKNDPKFKITEVQTSFKPNYNVAPSQQIPVVLVGSRILTTFRWGLIPYWANDKKIGYKMINARSETLIDKPSFKNSMKTKRCLVLASGFFEWDSSKHPHYIRIKNQHIIAYAGLWDEWTDKETNEKIRSCTIITCSANNLMKKMHDRMPVILDLENYDIWLTSDNFIEYRSLLIPCKDELMYEYEVSQEVNSPRNNRKELLEPVEKNT